MLSPDEQKLFDRALIDGAFDDNLDMSRVTNPLTLATLTTVRAMTEDEQRVVLRQYLAYKIDKITNQVNKLTSDLDIANNNLQILSNIVISSRP